MEALWPNNRFERDAPPASYACCLRAPQAKRYAALIEMEIENEQTN